MIQKWNYLPGKSKKQKSVFRVTVKEHLVPMAAKPVVAAGVINKLKNTKESL
jgi:hypothetical protein